MIVDKKLYNLVKTLNMNDDNEEKCYGVSTDFIRKLDGFHFHNHWRKSINKLSLDQHVSPKKKCNTDTSIWNHVLRVG